MNDNVLISIILPAHCASDAHEQYLREALESVAAQSYNRAELIIVDDCSPRDVAAIAQSVGGLPEYRIIRTETNLGHAASRNLGTANARGEFVAFLDHDDIWPPEKLAVQADCLNARPDAPMCYCEAEIFGERAAEFPVDQKKAPAELSVEWLATHANHIVTMSSVLIRTDALRHAGEFDTRYTSCDDLDMYLRLSALGPIIHITEPLARYRLHSANLNYSFDRKNDNRLLTSRILSILKTAPALAKPALAFGVVRKVIGRLLA